MKIISLGYTPVIKKQNSQNNNNPLFKGKISVAGLQNDTEALERQLSIVRDFVKYWANKWNIKLIDSELVNEGSNLICPEKIDHVARYVVCSLNETNARTKSKISFDFVTSRK